MRRSASAGQDRSAPADTRNGEYVSGNFFRTFGVQPWIGRLMTDADDVGGRAAGRGNELPHLARRSTAPTPPWSAPLTRSTGIRSP